MAFLRTRLRRANISDSAPSGEPPCQAKQAKLLLERPDRQECDYIQAIAWLQLAAERDSMHARMMLEEQNPNLTPKQLAWVDNLKTQAYPHPLKFTTFVGQPILAAAGFEAGSFR